ncbi:MAG: tRNA (adenosine(37)-N6)-threonylcarbamoyltransferase complex transferase subunit TsaD [Chloroflexi bacterium]|nr:tRNA (adenosine(37)-N6)-threonylcarbamoyltransferase complex transferase subunit TsaD [Chloroflexota bacterium]
MARVLGIETSCDETAAAIVLDGRHVEANVVATQLEMHERYGGVVPELAARLHLRAMVPVLEETLARAGRDWGDLDAIAVTHGPGLAPALLIGLNAAKALSYARRLPLIGVNHLGGHVYANWLVKKTGVVPEPEFPLVCLVVSGGHSDLVLMTGHGEYRRLGRTIDDAAGEAFDKVARMLGLGFPGGPPIQRAAASGNPNRFKLPRAWLGRSYDFSFSGLKTAVLHLVESLPGEKPVADVAAAFQDAVVDVLVTKTLRAVEEFGARQVLLAGGVAANLPLRQAMEARSPVPMLVPEIALCTDNGAMIAAAGHFQYEAGDRSGLDLDAIPALPLA